MSPKICSLAFDEVEIVEQPHLLEREMGFEPELKVLINRRITENSSLSDNTIVQVRGRINVSF